MKTRWKKAGVLAALMALSFTAGVYAQDSVIKVTAYLRPDFKVVVDGKPSALEFPPLIYNDKSYMPFTAIASLLGATVSWKDDTKTIYVNRIIYPDKQAQQPQNGLYAEVQMSNPQPVQVQYLGRNYIILQFGGTGGLYYRVSDAEKMGIDAGACRR